MVPAARIAPMRAQASDTPLDVERVQIQRYRDLGASGRLAAALELNATLDLLALAGIRARHGSLSPREERLRLFALRLGRDDMRNAFGWDPEDPGG